jgi:hypothetical protein
MQVGGQTRRDAGSWWDSEFDSGLVIYTYPIALSGYALNETGCIVDMYIPAFNSMAVRTGLFDTGSTGFAVIFKSLCLAGGQTLEAFTIKDASLRSGDTDSNTRWIIAVAGSIWLLLCIIMIIAQFFRSEPERADADGKQQEEQSELMDGQDDQDNSGQRRPTNNGNASNSSMSTSFSGKYVECASPYP